MDERQGALLYRVPGDALGQFVGCEPSSRVDGTHVLTQTSVLEREKFASLATMVGSQAHLLGAPKRWDTLQATKHRCFVSHASIVWGGFLKVVPLTALDPAAVVGGRCDEQPC